MEKKQKNVANWLMENSGSQFHRLCLGCGEKKALNPGYAANQSRIAECYNNSIDPNFKRALPEHC